MKKYIGEFVKRGFMFAWGGPAILAIIWYILWRAGKIESLTPSEVLIGVLSTSALAFIAAGVSIVHQIEELPKGFAALIQGSVLYIDYLGFYLLNGWISWDKIWIFTVIFAAAFVFIWAIVYIPIRIKVSKMNKKLS
ncbi:MAG: DUF3021 domain-containing protein [Lachnospiraceae bacterium]|nr:DUF3021 domain-containing protein [Lachnospiraceae bacterium]MBR6382626.1 DUF3021 domain-containing protein [Lachnospiraceae bacterium]